MELIQNIPFVYPVLMVSSSDHITGKTGVPLTIYLSKAGTASALISPAVTEIGFGKYGLHLTPAYVDTIGAWSLHVEAPGCDPFDSADQVISAAAALIPSSTPTTLYDTLKSVLNIAPTDSSQDLNLIRLIRFAVSVVEGITKRYFGAPRIKTDYFRGDRGPKFFLTGYLDDSDLANTSYPAGEAPSQTVVVSSRAYYSVDPWDNLVEGEDWERRGREIVILGFPQLVGICWGEYRVTYLEGYVDAPEDIKQAIIEIAMKQNIDDLTIATGLFGVTSESLGDFSYSRSGTLATGLLDVLSDMSRATLQRYKRKFI